MEEKLNKLITDVEVIKTRLDILTKNLPFQDHESRIRKLEDFKGRLMGAFIIISSLGGVIGGILFNIFEKLK